MNLQIIEKHGFQLVERLDETSRNVVWKAVQNNLDRTVILRILKDEASANPSEVDHFLTIARRFARIKSDSIAAVFDIVSEGTLHYVIMEHVDGPTLEELVSERGPLPSEQILRIAASLITSLEQMWSTAHIVHRNLKSSTIRMDARGVAKITDFSLAIVAGPGVDATAMDGGHIVGTPCFLSPEQSQGTHMLNTQSDMYALGSVLYHLATGKVPFEDLEVFAILAAHVKHQIPPPHRLNRGLPVELSWFIHRLMMKNPNNRYPDWDTVLQDIRSMLAGAPPSCVRPGEEYLSTIASEFDEVGADAEANAPRIRLKRKEKNTIAAYRSPVPDEHPQNIRRETLTRELSCWGVLACWLLLVFWFRAFVQADPDLAKRTPLRTQLSDVVTQISEALDDPAKMVPSAGDAGDPAIEEKQPSVIATTSAKPIQNDTSAAGVSAQAGDPPHGAVAQPPPTPAPTLAEGIPDTLRHGLAQALASADLAGARQLVKSSTQSFKEKEALQTLLDQMPPPESLVADFLKAQIGKPLILEHNGKQRTVIPRNVADGIVQVEANGRGAEFAIEKLTADEKLSWMDKPKDAAQNAAYCLTIMRSSRRAEIHARAAGCPLLAPVLIEAASLVPAATPPAE